MEPYSNMAASSQASTAPDVPGWLVLSIDKVRVALPQKDVKTIELVSALDVAVEGEMEAGWLEQDGKMWPAYGVDEQLNLRPEVPKTRRFCVMLREGDKLIGFLADQVRLLPADEDIAVSDLPGCLIVEDSPLGGLSLLDGDVVAAMRPGALAPYLLEMEARYGAD